MPKLPKKSKNVGLTKRRALYGYIFILPFILGFIFFMIKPMFESLRMSFCEVVISNSGFKLNWNSFANYKRAFLIDPEFNRMLTEAVTQMIYRSLATIVFSFFVALILNQKFKGRAVARSIFFLTVILSSGVLVGIEYSTIGTHPSAVACDLSAFESKCTAVADINAAAAGLLGILSPNGV